MIFNLIYSFKKKDLTKDSMGINYFGDFLKQHAPNCYFEVPLENFRGKRFAIDINHLAFMFMSTATKEVTERTNLVTDQPDHGEIERLALDNIIARLTIFLQYGITPVCILDSKSHPLKDHVKVKRNIDRNKIKTKLKEAETRLYETDPLFRTQGLVNEYAKYLKQSVNVSFDFMNQLKDVLSTVGFPVFSAADFNLETTDSEGVCAALCLQGNDYCVATVSTDSDYHVYGGNLEVTEIYSKYTTTNNVKTLTHYAKVRSLEAILQQLQSFGLTFTFDMFRDLCILQGTDFNPNIAGIGPKKSWDYIAKYGSIINMAQAGIDVSVLNYPNVFKMFASTIVAINIPPPDFNADRFREHGRNTFNLYQLRNHASTIADALSNLTVSQIIPSLSQLSVNDNKERSLLTNENQEPITSVINL